MRLIKSVVVSLVAGVLPLAVAGMAAADVVEVEEVIVGEEVVTPPPPPVEVGPDYNKVGPYLGLGVSYFFNEFDGGEGGPLDITGSWGFHARGGYRFMDYFALEGLYEYANNFGCDLGDNNDISITGNIFTVNGKGILPLGRFQPYLSGGVGFLNTTQSRTGIFRAVDAAGTVFAGRVGAGFDVYLTENISLVTEAGYLLPTSDLSDLNVIPLNVGMRFLF